MSKISTPKQWDLHGIQIFRGDVVQPRVIYFTGSGVRITLHEKTVAPVFTGKLQRHADGGRFNARSRIQLFYQSIKECVHLWLGFVFIQRKMDSSCNEIVMIESCILPDKPNEALNQQSCANQQDKRNCQFSNHKNILGSLPSGADRFLRLTLQSSTKTRNMPCWNQPKANAAEQRHKNRKA